MDDTKTNETIELKVDEEATKFRQQYENYKCCMSKKEAMSLMYSQVIKQGGRKAWNIFKDSLNATYNK